MSYSWIQENIKNLYSSFIFKITKKFSTRLHLYFSENHKDFYLAFTCKCGFSLLL